MFIKTGNIFNKFINKHLFEFLLYAIPCPRKWRYHAEWGRHGSCPLDLQSVGKKRCMTLTMNDGGWML